MAVSILVGCLKFCFVIIIDCHTRWETVEHFYANVECAFMKTRKLGMEFTTLRLALLRTAMLPSSPWQSLK